MKKKNVKLVACLSLTGFLALCGLPYMNNSNYNIGIMESQAAEITNTWESGNTTVTLDSEGTLTVTAKPGTDGRMVYLDVPGWQTDDIRQKVNKIEVKEGVTYIAFGAFNKFRNPDGVDIDIAETVTEIESSAFQDTFFKTVDIRGNVKLGSRVFFIDYGDDKTWGPDGKVINIYGNVDLDSNRFVDAYSTLDGLVNAQSLNCRINYMDGVENISIPAAKYVSIPSTTKRLKVTFERNQYNSYSCSLILNGDIEIVYAGDDVFKEVNLNQTNGSIKLSKNMEYIGTNTFKKLFKTTQEFDNIDFMAASVFEQFPYNVKIDNIKEIPSNAFKNASGKIEVNWDIVESVGESAFASVSDIGVDSLTLKNITLGNSVFTGNASVKELIIGNANHANGTFGGMQSLEKITLLPEYTHGVIAVANCNKLESIYWLGTISPNQTKSMIPSTTTIYCEANSPVETWCKNNSVAYKTLTDDEIDEIQNGKRPIINQFNLSFDKQNPSDLQFDFDLGSDKLGAKSIKNIIINGKKLIKDTDFVISDSTVTLNKSIFETLINDTYQVTVIFDNGYTIDDKVKIIVYGEDVILTPENTVPQQYATYNNENPKDISFKVYCESIDSIIINNKELDINDYIIAEYRTANINNPKLLTIKKEVLNTLKTGEYEIIVVTDGIMIRNKLSIFVTNKNNEDNTQPPIILDTVKYEFYKDYPDFIVIPFSFNRANSITEVKIGSNILDSTHYDIVDSTIIIDKDYLSTLDIGKYVVSVTFDDNTKRSNAQLIVYEKAADRAAPYLLQSHIIFNGNSINLSFDPGEGDLETTNVLALVLDNELILPNGDKVPFNSSNINKLQKAYEDYTNKENEEEVASPSNAKKEETNINNNENNDREDTNIKEDESIDNENNDSENTNINEDESNINDTKETNTNKNNIDNEDTNTNKDETINNKDNETVDSEDNKEDNNLIKVEIEQVESNSFNLFATLDDYDTVFVTNGTEIVLDGAYIESLKLSEGDHLIGAIFDNTERTTDVKKVILTIPKTDGEDKPTPPDDSDKEEPVKPTPKPDEGNKPTPKPDEGNKPTPPDNNNGGGNSGGGSSSGGSSGSNSKPDNSKPSPINPDGSLNPDYKPIVPDTGGKFEGEGNDWTYIKPDGSQAKNEWVGDGEDWYYIDENSKLKYDWALINNEWYMLNREHDGKFGAAKYGWYKENQDSQWYFMNPRDTKMLTGWQKINHKWYYFNINQGEPTYYGDNQKGWKYDTTKGIRPHGSMYANEITPDGYKTNEKGEWIE